jgi:PAS domain S-box-containing protein
MDPHPFVQQLEGVHQRAVALLERAQEAAPHSLRDWSVAEPTKAEFLRQTWHELTSTMAELLTVHDTFHAQRPRPDDLLEFAPDAFLVTDRGGQINEASEAAARLFAIPQAALLGKRLAEFVPPADVPAFEQSLAQLSATAGSLHREARLVSKSDTVFDGAFVAVPARDSHGMVVGIRWLVWDVSERKRQDKALLAARQAAERAAERAARLQTVIEGLAQALTPSQVLAAVIEHGAVALGAVAGELNLLSTDGTSLTTMIIGHPDSLLERNREFSVSAARPGADVLRSGQPLWLRSYQEYRSRYPHLADAGWSTGYQAVAVFPLLVDREPLGTLAASFAERRDFSPEDQDFLLALSRLAAQALARNRSLRRDVDALRQEVTDRAQVQAETDRTIAQLSSYTADMELVREEERRRLALELHDQLGGALTALKMDVFLLRRALGDRDQDVSARLGDMSDSITNTIEIVRSLASELRPAMLDDLGLPAALKWTASEFESRFGIACRWVTNTDDVALDSQRATSIFRVVQECLTNVVRHAQATKVSLSLHSQPGRLTVAVSDNGRGFSYSEAVPARSVGLAGIHERVRGIGGELEIRTAPGQGTLVRVALPLAASAPK